MILDNLFVYNDIIGTAMQASAIRNDVIQNNIANNDVPNYKKKTVVFEETLSGILDRANRTGRLELDKAVPSIKVIHENFSYRIDGNNVDHETEMVDLYENSVRYDTMASSIINNYKRINLVLSAR